MKILKLALMISFLGLGSINAQNNVKHETVATITDFSGIIFVKKGMPDSRWKQARLYIPLNKDDSIKTGGASNAELTMEDGSIFKIGQNTELNLMAIEYNTQNKKQNFLMKLFKGMIMCNVEKTGNPESMISIHTPTAVFSVRGTEFIVENEGQNSSSLGVYGGIVSARNYRQDGSVSNEETLVKPEQETIVKQFESPLRPYALKGKFIQYRETMAKLKERKKNIRDNWKNIMVNRTKISQEIMQKTSVENPQLKEKIKQKLLQQQKQQKKKQ